MPHSAVVFLVALLLGYFSPWLASPHDGMLLSMWFNLLPLAAQLWLPQDSDAATLALDVAVLTTQYVGLYGLIRAAVPVAKFVRDFVSAPRHRSGLVR